jgi:hypothetical protein
MKKGRFSEEQIIGILKEHEAGRKMAQWARRAVCRNAERPQLYLDQKGEQVIPQNAVYESSTAYGFLT